MRKATGIVRKIDELGRVVIPRELTKTLDIQLRERGITDGTPLEIFVEGDSIILKKYQPSCIFCGSFKDVKEHMGKKVCKACAKAIKN